MKRHKRLYGEICSFENIVLAARKAQRGKRFTPAAMRFNRDLESELTRLQQELQAQTYRPGPFRVFEVHDPKPRVISAAPFRDRVVHHAYCNVVEPIFDRTFIHGSYACRPGKGTHAAVDALTRFMQDSDYVLKCDIRRYFASVDHAILKALVRRKIGCPSTLWLTDLLIDHCAPLGQAVEYFLGDDLLTPLERPTGLPVGNQTSQFFANVYLNGLDHFVQEELGFRRYIRYVDDFVVLADDKERLWAVRDAVVAYLGSCLRLRLHPAKVSVTPAPAGVDFLGYRVFPSHRLLRRTSGIRFQRRLRAMQQQYQDGKIPLERVGVRVASWLGHARHADTYGLSTAILDRAVFRRA